ncbi:MAG: hypothetical protein MJ069_00205 [Salinivirgaceae bacterium]|nr:hypothetical protein [Salinivirgaceae bacterium]
MKLIIEAGGTKCKWATSQKNIITTTGFSPNTAHIDNLIKLAREVENKLPNEPDSIIYYGAGCGNSANQQLVKKSLASVFTTNNIRVTSDLEAAGFALWNTQSGLAAILGTGASAGLYNGNEIENQSPSLGYLLGDEGSGAYLGRELIRSIVRQQCPTEISELFFEQYNLSTTDLIRNVYAAQQPNAYMASFVPFMAQNCNNQFINDLLYNSFTLFYNHHIAELKSKSTNLGFVGGVAYTFQSLLKRIIEPKGFELKFLKDALSELVK